MTRATQVTQAARAMRKARPAPSSSKARPAPSSPPEPASMTFLIDEDNGGGYHWTIVGGGETLARSASFGSYEDARHAVGIVHRGAARAGFETGPENRPSVAIPARRNAGRGRSDAESRLDQGGSSQAMPR